jgi:hypothetical protein
MFEYNGERWIRISYDTGAATTAFPVELVGGMPLTEQGQFIVANGSEIPHYGRVQLNTRDEQYNARKINGSVTEVHKPLGSGSEIAQGHDAVVWDDGGSLIPKNHPIAKGLRAEYWRLCAKHGTTELVQLHKEGPLYNFYVKLDGPAQQLSAKTLKTDPANSRQVQDQP